MTDTKVIQIITVRLESGVVNCSGWLGASPAGRLEAPVETSANGGTRACPQITSSFAASARGQLAKAE